MPSYSLLYYLVVFLSQGGPILLVASSYLFRRVALFYQWPLRIYLGGWPYSISGLFVFI